MTQKNPKKTSARENTGKKSSESKALAVPGVDLRQLEQVLEFMSQNSLEEFEYANGDLRIRLKRALGDPNSAAPRALPPRRGRRIQATSAAKRRAARPIRHPRPKPMKRTRIFT